MGKSAQPTTKSRFPSKWIALEDEKIIAEGIDLAEVYAKAKYLAKSKPQFRRIPV